MYCPKCGFELPSESKFCPKCGEKYSLNNQAAENKQTVTKDKPKQKLEGFGGWLALFGLGVFATPIFIFLQMVVEPEAYDGLDIFFNILIIFAYAWLTYLMVKRRKIFKKWFLGVGIFQVLLTGLIALGANSDTSLFSESELSDINTSAFRTLFYVIIWALYLWNSQRAKNTFIN